jgi:catechol 2,3-dioxygenase-like lactoylglutathione lyase family enzyme
MGIHRLNHAVLYVRDLERTKAFYSGVLGFRVKLEIPGQAAFFTAPGSTNDHDLGVFALGDRAGDTQAGRSTVGMYHLAWEVEDLADLKDHAEKLARAGALVGASNHGTTKSLYAKDPDGLEFEVVWLIPAHLLTPEDVLSGSGRPLPLDLDKEIARFGARTRGGLGISIPLGVPGPEQEPSPA